MWALRARTTIPNYLCTKVVVTLSKRLQECRGASAAVSLRVVECTVQLYTNFYKSHHRNRSAAIFAPGASTVSENIFTQKQTIICITKRVRPGGAKTTGAVRSPTDNIYILL